MLISLAHDLDRGTRNCNLTDIETNRSTVPYHEIGSRTTRGLFTYGMVGYISGLLLAVFISQISNHAQPALLYIVPFVLIFITGRAIYEGRLVDAWHGRKEKVDFL